MKGILENCSCLKLKKGKVVSWQYALFAGIFAIACGAMSLIRYNGSVWGSVEENYLLPVQSNIFVVMMIAFVIGYIVLLLFDYILALLLDRKKEYTWQKKKFAFITGVIIFIAWLPYYLSYYPGGIYSDTFSSISMALEERCRRPPLAAIRAIFDGHA